MKKEQRMIQINEVVRSVSESQKLLAQYFCEKQGLLSCKQESEILSILNEFTNLKSRIKVVEDQWQFRNPLISAFK